MMTVTKITGPVTVLMSWMKASASHLAFSAWAGAMRPKAMPAAIATSTQNQSCLEETPLTSCPAKYPLIELSFASADDRRV